MAQLFTIVNCVETGVNYNIYQLFLVYLSSFVKYFSLLISSSVGGIISRGGLNKYPIIIRGRHKTIATEKYTVPTTAPTTDPNGAIFYYIISQYLYTNKPNRLLVLHLNKIE